jgi:hypothetical protein
VIAPGATQAQIAQIRTHYDFECRTRDAQNEASRQQYDLDLAAYLRNRKKHKEDKASQGKCLEAIRESISDDLRGGYLSITNCYELWNKLDQDHSRVHRTVNDQLESKWSKWGMDTMGVREPDMDTYLNNFNMLTVEMTGAGMTQHQEFAAIKEKVVNGLDHRYIAAAQILTLMPIEGWTQLNLLLRQVGDTTRVVSARNSKSKDSTDDKKKSSATHLSSTEFTALKSLI